MGVEEIGNYTNGTTIAVEQLPSRYMLSPFELASLAVSTGRAMQKVSEFAAFLDLVASGKPRRMMEIGFGNGGTAWAFSKMETLEHMILLNLPNGPWGGSEDEQMLEYIVGNSGGKRIDYIAGNSQNVDSLEAVEARLKGQLLDFLFIDGDHSAVGVAADYDLYKKFVRPGGLIAFHDIAEHPKETGCEVKVFWDALIKDLPEDSYCQFIEEAGGSWGGIGVVRV